MTTGQIATERNEGEPVTETMTVEGATKTVTGIGTQGIGEMTTHTGGITTAAEVSTR